MNRCFMPKATPNPNPNYVPPAFVKEKNIQRSDNMIMHNQEEEKTEEDEIQAKIKQSHLNGYLFDSLMYRYIRAREIWREYEIEKEHVTPEVARERFNRDLMRFRTILQEVMPNHD